VAQTPGDDNFWVHGYRATPTTVATKEGEMRQARQRGTKARE